LLLWGGVLTEDEYTAARPRAGVLSALTHYWYVVVITALVFLAAAIVLGLKRPAQYSADAHVSVGQVYSGSPAAIGTVIQGTESLASVYSRAIHADAVERGVTRRLKDGPRVGSGSFSATPIPDSPLIKITATTGSEASAVALANAASAALAGYVNKRTRDAAQYGSLAGQYERAALAYRRRQDKVEQLTKAYAADPSQRNRAALDRASARADTARMQRDALVPGYQSSLQGNAEAPQVEVFARAGAASSDRYPVLEILVFGGLVAGLAAGATFALLLGLRAPRPVPTR
jgi:capsular polysaccharide biosynthesis protein